MDKTTVPKKNIKKPNHSLQMHTRSKILEYVLLASDTN